MLPSAFSKIVYKPPGSKKHRPYMDGTDVSTSLSDLEMAALGPTGSVISLQFTAALTLSLYNPIF